MRVISCIFTEHNLWLVCLAAAVCIAGSFISFGLFKRASLSSGARMYGWVFLTAIAAGSSVWCTHFIAMLAYEVKAAVSFDPVLTMASLLIAIAGCGLGFGLGAAKRDSLAPEICGAIAGSAVALMHYSGMAAYHVAGIVEWNALYVVASVVIAAVLGALSFDQALRQPLSVSRHLAPALFVLAVVGLHFTGMAAVHVMPTAALDDTANQEFAVIAIAVAGVGLMIIGTGMASYLIDERSSRESFAKLQEMALNDSLTGLPNRAAFSNYLTEEIEWAAGKHCKLAVIGIDLDRFKEINDQRGHEAGDRALKTIGKRLADILDSGEFVARIGGDEFAAVKRLVDAEDVHDFIRRMERALNLPIDIDGSTFVTGGSIGVALCPDDGDDVTRLVLNADLAMYRAKQSLERKVCFYDPAMDEAVRARASMVADLRNAIANGEFELHYQVQNDVDTGNTTGHEVLLRWRHPVRGMVSPVEFIPIAEETGSIVEIGEWVLRTACTEAASWDTADKIAINVSGVQLTHGDLSETIRAILAETGFSASRLEIEITETAIIQDKLRALHILRRIRDLGVTIALDDFGIGYSSLETLRAFPFDKIKLDRSFTGGLERDPQAMAIVRAVLALGKSLRIRVLAEGVETDGQLSILRGEGCDEAQGYFLGRPARIPDLRQPTLLRQRPLKLVRAAAL